MSLIKILRENKNYEFICEGNFQCRINELSSLDGSPVYVEGDFVCVKNKLISLEGAPEYIGGDFLCYANDKLSKDEVIKYYKTGAVKGIIYSDYGDYSNLKNFIF